MSKNNVGPRTVIEWSPNHVSWIGGAHTLVTAPNLNEAAGQLPHREVTVAISRRSAFVRAYRVPNAGKAEIRRIISMQIGQIFPIAANELAFDFHLTHDVNAEGRLAVVAAMRSADLLAMHQQAKAAGLRVAQVTLAALGSPLVAKSVGHESAAVVHHSAEGLAIDLVAGGELRYSRVAPMPSTSIGIDAEVSRTFAASLTNCVPTVAAGGLLVAEAEASTNTWALEALGAGHLDINIETADQAAAREKRKQAERLRLSLLAFGAGMVLFTFQILRWNDSQAKYDRAAGKAPKELARLKKLLDAEIAKGSSATNAKLVLTRAFQPAQTFSDVFTLASNDAPKGVWLTGFSIERGKPLTIRGTAMSGQAVVDYETSLVAEKRFRDVKPLFQNTTDLQNTPVVQFSVSAFPVGNLPLIEATKTKLGGG